MADEFGIADDETVALTDTDENDGIYANAEAADAEGAQLKSVRGDTSDEIDPRKLVRDPTLSEIRWYYRRTFAKTIVDKPIDDAFKNGFEFTSDNADEARRLLNEPDFDGDGEGFTAAYRLAEKKARRDGFALIFLGTSERNGDLAESPVENAANVDEISHLKVLTIDDLTETAYGLDDISDATGLDEQNFEVRQTGIVVNTDPTSADYRTPVGYMLDASQPKFIHRDRIIHLTWNPEVDGDYEGSGVRRYENASGTTLGQYEGDSVLIPSYDLMKGISKGNWSIMQAIFRNASHMYSVELPVDADQNDMNMALKETRNINAKSTLVFPDGYDVDQHESGNEMEVDTHYEVLFNQVCAAHEMTKSVLFGTQAGTVSGSEVDIKNYFNKVERYRSNRAVDKIQEYLTRAKTIKDGRTADDFAYDIDVEWGPLFKVDRETRVTMLQNEAQALSTLIGKYAMTPDEARAVLSADFAEVDLDDLTEDQWDALDRIQFAEVSQAAASSAAEAEMEGTAEEGGREGGREQGQRQAQNNPTTADGAENRTDGSQAAQLGDEGYGSDTIQTDSDGTQSLTAQLERLGELHDNGLLTDDEFAAVKDDIIESVLEDAEQVQPTSDDAESVLEDADSEDGDTQ